MNKLNLEEMLDIQDDLNENTIPNWKNRLTMDDFNMAIIDESAELSSSGRQWAWWKEQGPIDEWNEKIEVIDLLHFFLAKVLLEGFSSDSLINSQGVWVPTTDFFIGEDTIPRAVIDFDGEFNSTEFVGIHRALLDNDFIGDNGITAMNQLVAAFGMDAEEVSAIYTLKSTLNFIRQEGGYKNGTYQKVLDGREDNELLEDLYLDFANDVKQGRDGKAPIPSLDDLQKSTRALFKV